MAERRRARAGRVPAELASRVAALDVLVAVRTEHAYTNLVLPAVLRAHGLSSRDGAFTTEVASGSIRMQGTYDAVLAACIDRPLAKVQPVVLDALRLGVHQLLSMRVPTHAAISTTVDLVRLRANAGAAGFANAVLRRVAEHDLATWIERVAPSRDVDPTGHAVVAHSHPAWIVEALREAVGESELDRLLAADNAPPRVTLVARPGRCERDELPGEPTTYSPYGKLLAGGDPGAVPAVAEGRAGVQDEGSQLVAMALAAAPVTGSDATWLDLCAGPGGKAALLAGLAGGRGARLLAVERHEHRAGLVVRSLAGSGGVLGVLVADGTRAPVRPASCDRVLVDAPCTGLGALRRRPEARWARTPEDLTALVPLQRNLLTAALDLVRPGGVVLYATCSPVLAETAGVVAAVLAGRDDVVVEDVGGLLPGVTDCAGPVPGSVQLWPHRHGTDAMFLCLLRKRLG